MTAWDMGEAKNLVEISYGKTQAELAYQSMCSTIDRQKYARYHYRNAKNLFDAYVGKLHSPMSYFQMSMGCVDDVADEFNQYILEAGAHVTACVQSLHAMGDIFAHAIYFALGNNLELTRKGEQKLYLSGVRKKLCQAAGHQSLVRELDSLVSGDDFIYLCALDNRSKHRSLIRSEFRTDLKGKKPDPYTLEFQEFSYDKDKKPYPRRSILPFLQSEIDRQSSRIHEAGNVLNSVLREIKNQPA